MFKSIAIALPLMVGSLLIANEDQLSSASEQELISLDWQITGTYKLPSSHSSLSVPSEHLAVIGKDAEKLSNLIGNDPDSSLEAITIDDSFNNTVYFFHHDAGYISLSDWEEVDPNELLSAIRENTEESNKEKRKKGLDEIHIIGWIEEPTLDKHANTVYWSIESLDGDSEKKSFNSVALRLGRHGFERVVWVGDVSEYKAFGGELALMLRSHTFDPGHRYSDHEAGDKVASYGIATLVAATIGAKVAKAGGLAILFKKVGGFIAAGIAALFYKLRKIFKRKHTDDAANE